MKEITTRLTNQTPGPLMILAALFEFYNIKVPYLQSYQQHFIDEFQKVSSYSTSYTSLAGVSVRG
jgi:hypothetical protein